MKEQEPSKEALEAARTLLKWTAATLAFYGALKSKDEELFYINAARALDAFAAEAVEGVRAKWKAQRASIVETLEEWEAAFSDQPEYQSAIGDVLAWLNGDMP